MSVDREEALRYLSSSAPWIWDWQDGGEVVGWSDGSTIVFRAELEVVLSRLVPEGLPRFGAIILLLAACRENWLTNSVGRSSLVEFVSYFHAATESYQIVVDTLEGLDRVHAARDMVGRPEGKAELAAAVFEGNRNRQSIALTSDLMQASREGLSPSGPRDMSYDLLTWPLADLAELRPGLARLDRDSLERRLRTGLEAVIEPASVELPPGIAVRELIRQLLADEELGGVARLARLLLAAVQLPRPLHDHEDLPIGGISDISNRGPLHHLMISELAHDDLTLAARVAMNEALYLRREPLARAQPRRRFVLLDSGLRLWGVPRVFATAVGLAVAAQASPLLAVDLWRADGDRIAPVDFTTAQGLTDHLAVVDHRIHPGDSLPALLEAIQSAKSSFDGLIITSEDVLADRTFQQALEGSRLEAWHLATVRRDGRFRLLLRTRRGTKLLSEATLSLEEVLAPRKPATPAIVDSSVLPALPAIYGVQQFPLRCSVAVRPENSWHVYPWGLLTLTKDGRLMKWEGHSHGATLVAEGLPPGKIHWCSSISNGRAITLVVGKLSQWGLYAVQLNWENSRTQSVRVLQLAMDRPCSITMHQGVLLVMSAKEVNAVDPKTGALLATRRFRFGLHGQWGRFVPLQPPLRSQRWAAISFDGTAIQVEMIDHSTSAAAPLRWARDFAARHSRAGARRGGVGKIASWFAGARRWVAARVTAFDEQLEALRHRELDRLMHLLENQPDEGLRYAVPLTAETTHRGVARRSSRLSERLVDFSLGRLGGGGGPGDFWAIPGETRRRLVEKYVQLANREIALGRHRRAAYILAELLGDLRSAAATLADGGFFREAAALYEQRLKDSLAAARCLEQGGLLSEAIAYYDRFGNHEKVGDLYGRLEHWDLARQAYQRAAESEEERGDLLRGAQLWDTKLQQPETARAVLLRGWPNSRQARLCLDESFRLLGRDAAHDS